MSSMFRVKGFVCSEGVMATEVISHERYLVATVTYPLKDKSRLTKLDSHIRWDERTDRHSGG